MTLLVSDGNTSLPPISLAQLIPPEKNLTSFYRYKGSLTTPGCTESVVWTLFESPIPLSADQVSTKSLCVANGDKKKKKKNQPELHVCLSLPTATGVLGAQVPRREANGGDLQAGPAPQRPAGVSLWGRNDPDQWRLPYGRRRRCFRPVSAQLGCSTPGCTKASFTPQHNTGLQHPRCMVAETTAWWCGHRSPTVSSYDTNDQGALGAPYERCCKGSSGARACFYLSIMNVSWSRFVNTR